MTPRSTVAPRTTMHREGNLARQLWLSEWAWRNGIDPEAILLVVGFGSVALLAGVLLSETKSRRALSAILTLLGLGLLLLLIVNVQGTPKPNQKPDDSR